MAGAELLHGHGKTFFERLTAGGEQLNKQNVASC